jgi:hypothetical protein
VTELDISDTLWYIDLANPDELLSTPVVMCKARPKALKPSPRSLTQAEPWSGLGRDKGSAHHF